MDDYREASVRSLLLVLVGVVVAMLVIWLLVSWGMNVLDLQAAPADGQRLPGINK